MSVPGQHKDAAETVRWRGLFAAAEMRWMSVEDAEITVPARDVAEIGRALSAAEARLADTERQRDEAQQAARLALDVWEAREQKQYERANGAEAVVARQRQALQDFNDAMAVDDIDPRLRYVMIQVGREDLALFREALAGGVQTKDGDG